MKRTESVLDSSIFSSSEAQTNVSQNFPVISTYARDVSGVAGAFYAPANYLTYFTGVAQNNSDVFVLGTQSNACVVNTNYKVDPIQGYHQLYSVQIQGNSQDYTATVWNNIAVLNNLSNGQVVYLQMTEPTSGLNPSGIDVQFLNGGISFVSFNYNGQQSQWITRGGSTAEWNKGVVALPDANTAPALQLSSLTAETINAQDSIAAKTGLGVTYSWSPVTGYGEINVNTALSLATGKAVPHVTPPPPTLSTLNWGIGSASFQDAWTAGYTGKGITIAMIDDGIDPFNPALSRNLLTDISSAFAPLQGTNVDSFGEHGSFVASQMTAANLGSVANPSAVTGGAYDAKLMSLNAWSYAAGSYKGIYDSVAAGITYAVDKGAHVINISLSQSPLDEITTALQYATSKGVVVCISSANGGGNVPLAFPATQASLFGNVIAVGASDWPGTGSVITQSPFSQMANSSKPYNFLEAPGANVLGYTLTTDTSAATIKYNSGTSFSSPMVAAEIAILEQALIKIKPTSSLLEIAAEAVHDLTTGLVGIVTNPNPSPYGPSPNPYGLPT